MNRKSFIIGAMLITVLTLTLTASAALTYALSAADGAEVNPSQIPEGRVSIWMSTAENGDPVRRLDPGTAEAWIVVRSNRGTNDHDKYVAELQDATGISVFRSGTLALPTGPYTTSVSVSGTQVFQGYVGYTQEQRDELVSRVDDAISALEEERGKPVPNAGRVTARIGEALAVQQALDAALERLRAFDNLEADADTAFGNAQGDLSTVNDEGNQAISLLGASEIDWDAAAARLQAMRAAAVSAVGNIDTGLAAVDTEAERHFPETPVPGRCSQNQVVLMAELRDSRGNVTYSPATDSWWTVGIAGAPERVTNPQQPIQTGALQADVGQIYATTVQLPGRPVTHTTTIRALVLDGQCVPVGGAMVHFAVDAADADQANLSANQVATDANGEAEVSLQATDTLGDGSVQVTATADSASASTTVEVIGPPDSIQFLGEFGKWRNFGVRDIVQIDVLIRDENDRNVIDGTPVTFSIEPPDHTFSDGEVGTDNGRATATLIFGTSTGSYTVRTEAGGADGLQIQRQINVVDVPSDISVRVLDTDTGDPVDTIFVWSASRSAQIQVQVWSDENVVAPDATVVQWDFADANDSCWATISDPREDLWGYRRRSLTDGQASATLVASTSSTGAPGCPPPTQGLAYEQVQIKVMAFYCQEVLDPEGTCMDSQQNPVPPEAVILEKTVTIDLRGRTIFLPLVHRD